MRYALLSDVHANLPALEAVLAAIDARGDIDAVFHLGDLVGYAPWPDETVALLRARGIAGIAGNYDSTVATDYAHCGCRYEDPRQEALAHASYEWTRAHVSAATRAYLGVLPFRLDLRPLGGHAAGPTITLLHGNHVLNTVYVTADRSDDFLRKLIAGTGARAGDVLCVGHTHKAWHREIDGVHVVNTGSVGRPKDGDPRAGYVVLDTTGAGVDVGFERVTYDVARAADGIRRSTLPDEFAHYLESGGLRLDAADAADASTAVGA